MNRLQLRDRIRKNLVDAGITYYTEENINDILQDAYDLIAAESQCIIKSVTLDWQAKVNYLDFITNFSVTDYLGSIAIFNNTTNQWLNDSVSIRDFDRIRRDWEKWVGTPQFWTPHSQRYIAIAPKYPAVSGQTFVLFYYAQAPQFTLDTDTPLVATDMQKLFEFYCTGDLLESAEEISKAQKWTSQYLTDVVVYKERCHNLAKNDLLLRL
jgi:hypothetical protein